MVRDILTVVACVLAAIGGLLLLEKRWPALNRREHNEIIGWQLSVLGAVYSVMLGFMLYTVWTNFQLAKQNVGAEANSLVNVSRLANGLPAEQRNTMQALARSYADLMVHKEWPDMEQSRLTPESHAVMIRMWRTLTSVQPSNAGQASSLDHAQTELSSMTEHRRLREVQIFDRLPGLLWTVLISGAALLLFCCTLLGARSAWIHMVLIGSLAFLLALLLITISSVDRPLQGWIRVSPAAFQRAAASLQEE
ncbi:MAG: hypothetical protein ACR2JE_09885 [Acidobacteriaceae bacterium]